MASPLTVDNDLKRSDKKLAKKMVKIEKRLMENENILISQESTKILCVQNGGLVNGVSQEELLPLFSKFGVMSGIVMLPRKQYCFVCYADAASAALAHEKLNGFLLRRGPDPAQDVYLYLCFVEKVPPSISPSYEKPPGLDIVEEFVSEETEQALIKLMDLDADGTAKETSLMKHRRVKHFGFEFKYGINDVDVNDPLTDGIPSICHEFLNRAKDQGLVDHFPDQLTINSYEPGQGIPAHVDTREAFEDGIIALSLGSQVVMDFRHDDGRHVSVLLPRRSLMVMRGESRYVWSHGITPRKSDIVAAQACRNLTDSRGTDENDGGLTLQNRGRRVSFTFRKVIKDRQASKHDSCKNDDSGDVSLEDTSVPQTEEEAVALERKHVNKVYEDIADHFSGTRYKPWPRVIEFVMQQPPLSLLADVGCGNGKCLGANKELFEIGSDFSSNLASICHSRGFETCVGDVTCLPFRSGSFDVVLCIAVIHHMATKHRRHKALSEVVRVLRRGGRALVYVWAMEQELNKSQSKYIKPRRQMRQDGVTHQDAADTTSDRLTCDSTSVRAHENGAEKLVGKQSDKVSEDSDIGTGECSVGDTVSGPASGLVSCSQQECHKPDLKTPIAVRQISTRHRNNVTEKSPDLEDLSSTETSTNACSVTSVSADSSSEVSQASHDKKLAVHVNRTQFKDQDLLVPWQLKTKSADKTRSDGSDEPVKADLFHRFYHVFRQGELEAMCKRVPGCAVTQSYYDQGNWCVVLERL
ncbi:hypothetical protein EGW08_009777 [Elysia chlorotica]|uniref:tRNA (carboxymethyluridine(34)-5-O)-methyltransferase n=1 Tax=Elysia chlorotica TaxID=188477 RepID=A0A3S0ZTK3_ELYCH|nr:hypothetical protein EGW08_009777 [Elysia chlorotica]